MNRKFSMALGILLVFAVTVLILLRILPGPYKPTDYLVIGTLATFVCILLAFLVVISTSDKGTDTFFKRKR
jgi:multisubunit Na+/H+ antiporter MnhF subunit